MNRTHTILLSVAILLLSVACTSTPHDVTRSSRMPDIYPDYTGVTVPAGIAPLNFVLTDPQATTLDVTVKGDRGGTLHTNGSEADFDLEAWHCLLEQNRGARLTVTVCAERNGRWTQYADFLIYVAEEPLGEWGVTYRLVPPSYAMYSKMGLYQRDLSNFEETPLMVNTRIPNQCVNCHTANRTDPDQFVFHVRGNHGATIIGHGSQHEVLQAKNDTLGGSMVYPYWHPGGRYCAFSTNKTAQLFHTSKKNKRIEVYDTASDVFVYDTRTHTMLCDTLLMRKDWAENTPVFSPDGKWLYFTTARQQVFPTDYEKQRYSLCRVAFDERTGRLGHEVDTLISASATGKSVCWPRPSYDGHYILYTRTDYGYFSVWHPEADLWLLDLRNGSTRPLKEVNSDRAESLHAWSTNSRWILFTSRRDDGLYTRLYLAHIDGQGRAGKPFLLPQRHPGDYYRRLMYSYNTPDFTSRPVRLQTLRLQHDIEGSARVKTETKKY